MGLLTWSAGLASAVLCLACGQAPRSPLEGIRPDLVKSVVVSDSHGRSRELTGSEIAAFLAGLQGLRAFKTGKVAADLDITVFLKHAPPLALRMGERNIGPAVPGSDVAWRWELPDSSLHQRLSESVTERPNPDQWRSDERPNNWMKLTKPASARLEAGFAAYPGVGRT